MAVSSSAAARCSGLARTGDDQLVLRRRRKLAEPMINTTPTIARAHDSPATVGSSSLAPPGITSIQRLSLNTGSRNVGTT